MTATAAEIVTDELFETTDATDEATESVTEPASEPTLVEQCQALANVLGAQGIGVNFGTLFNLSDLKPAVEAIAAGSILITKGVCTQGEWEEAVFTTLREVLSSALDGVAEAKRKEAEEAAKGPPLIVPDRAQPTRAELRALRALGGGSMHNAGARGRRR